MLTSVLHPLLLSDYDADSIVEVSINISKTYPTFEYKFIKKIYITLLTVRA